MASPTPPGWPPRWRRNGTSRWSCSGRSCRCTKSRSTCQGCARSCVTCRPPTTAGWAATGTSPRKCPAATSCSPSATSAGTARLRGALAGLAITGSPPERLVGWLNDLVHHVDPEHTASVVAGYFDPPTRVLTWAQAGHPPPVLVRDGKAETLSQPPGVLLGAGRSGYEAASLAMQPQDLLLLYSDGLIERRNRSLEDGLAALTAAAAGTSDPELVSARVFYSIGVAHEHDTCLVARQAH